MFKYENNYDEKLYKEQCRKKYRGEAANAERRNNVAKNKSLG